MNELKTARQNAADYIKANAKDVEQGQFYRMRVSLVDINPSPAFSINGEETVFADCYDPRLMASPETFHGDEPCEVMFTTSETTPDGLFFELDLAKEDR